MDLKRAGRHKTRWITDMEKDLRKTGVRNQSRKHFFVREIKRKLKRSVVSLMMMMMILRYENDR